MKKIMEMLQAMKQKNEKKDNKGFSLVELIIVIAIMAILVGVVGTQVIPYIEKSRKAKDVQILSGYCTDAMTAYSSNAATLDASKTYTITLTAPAAGAAAGSTWTAAVSGGATTENSALQSAFVELNDITTTAPGFESKAGKDIKSITIKCQNAGDMVELTVTNNTAKYSFDKITSK